MYDLSAIETDLISRLSTVQSTYNLSVGALNAEKLNRPFNQAQVLVSYRRSEFSSPQSLHQFQFATISFELITRFKDLRSHAQAYPILSALRDRLWNYVPASVDSLEVVEPIRQVDEKFSDHKLLAAGIWTYSQTYTLKMVCTAS
jgi:hypothetical protein